MKDFKDITEEEIIKTLGGYPISYMFSSDYYEKRYTDERHICHCPSEKAIFHLCEKELKKFGIKQKEIDQFGCDYYSTTNGYYRMAYGIYFHDIRKFTGNDLFL